MDMDIVLLSKFSSGEWRPSKKQSVDMASELIKLRNLIDLIGYNIDKVKGKAGPDRLCVVHERYLERV